MRRLFLALVASAVSPPTLAAQIPPPACLPAPALQELVEQARAARSDGLVVVHDGRVLVDETFGKPAEPVYIASAGKSLTSLAIGRLLHTGQLDSLDQPVWTLFPEWKQGRKQEITIRHLLDHTSGLQNHPNASVELEPPPDHRVPDVVRLALAAELSEAPGSVARYNNKAVALLGGIIERASGRRMDRFFEEEFFRPMGIVAYDWIRDGAGQPTAHGAFMLTARDLARFGELMLDGGTYGGRRFVDASWVDASFEQSQPYQPVWGLLWWRLPAWTHFVVDRARLDTLRARGVDGAFVERLRPLQDRTFEDRAAYQRALAEALGPGWQRALNDALTPLGLNLARIITSPETLAYYADGFRGNHLVIVPGARLVAARVKGWSEDFDPARDTFPGFVERVAGFAAGCTLAPSR